MIATHTRYMTTSALNTAQPTARPLSAWTALRTRIQDGAERRQLRRELRRGFAPISLTLSGTAHGDNAVTRELREMLRT